MDGTLEDTSTLDKSVFGGNGNKEVQHMLWIWGR